MNTATIILQQLGENRFLAMTGVKNLMTSGNDLTMQLPRCKSKANYLSIRFDAATDTYTMVWIRVRRYAQETVKEMSGVYCDMLRTLFTDETGLYTSL